MALTSLRTARLELLLATPEIFRCDLAGRASLAACLEARVPPTWPPEFLDEETLRQFISLSSDPGSGFASFYWVLLEDDERTLVGDGGMLRESPGRMMIGYALLDEWQGRGFGTEAVGALVEFAFRDPGVDLVVAYTYPDRAASIRVLEKNGFVRSGAGGEPGTIGFERRRQLREDEGGPSACQVDPGPPLRSSTSVKKL